MKPMQIIHAVATLLLLVAVVVSLTLVLTGLIEIRIPNQGPLNARPDAKANLLVVRGAKPNMEFPIFEGPNVIGRADQKPVEIDLTCQETPERIWSSRQHAVITCENGALIIEDLNSTNGTFINRERVAPGQKQRIKMNDLLQIG